MKAIAYSLFGYNHERYTNCFTFDSYLAGVMLSIRLNRLVFPNWMNIIETDHSTHNAFKELFDYLEGKDIAIVNQNKDGAQLCQAMLWRCKPVFKQNHPRWAYTHVLCRDLDSLSTYREAQAVQMWVNTNKAMHAITDSVSHDVPLLGGLIGFNPESFTAKSGITSFTDFMNKCKVDLSYKGSDQTFLNQAIYPLIAEKGHDSITQHYFKGHGKTWLSDFHTCNCWIDSCRQGHKEGCYLNVTVEGVHPDLAETNEVSEHMGASGWNQTQTMNLIAKHKDKFTDLDYIEQKYPNIFYWQRT